LKEGGRSRKKAGGLMDGEGAREALRIDA